MGLKIHQDGFIPTNSLEWHNAYVFTNNLTSLYFLHNCLHSHDQYDTHVLKGIQTAHVLFIKKIQK